MVEDINKSLEISVVNCANCGNQLSARAKECPKCHYPTPQNTEYCRVCGAALPRNRHRHVNSYTYTYLRDGTTQYGQAINVAHSPCPNCGEPQPLKRVTDPFLPVLPALIAIALLLAGGIWLYNRNTEKTMQEGNKIAHHDACMVLPLAMADYIDKLSTSILDNAINQNSGKLGHLSGWSHISMTASKGQKAGQYRLEINTDMGNPGKESRSVFPQIISINLKAEDKKLSIASISTGNVSANGSSNLRQALSETMQLPELPDRVGSSSKTNWAIEFALGNNGHCTTDAYMRALTTPPQGRRAQ